ncbi:mechanosensitive ion channel family protein [Phocaeicola dorei]|uniref:Mechanosensitive ion channel n=1 Tax=Phocaeicola dorei TaxID=357276 RepID=A0A4V1YXG3_9BACT|nr:mechanosensitive ion channel domain-containing protein [Phocaeicola dorei]KAA5395970.1 mechanosensitive ion channel [Phocaeicola dorei]KAA5400161.1 mechanosensitive ion channel [Phocaeicola dorei]KAA5408006.1 mechanosensitive ion channel [Phocaeicola dorei]RYT96805.1 transporter [Phocaeicola dorei]
MNTNEFARILLTWIKSFLSWIGIPRDRLNELDEIIFLILIVVIAFAVGAVFHYLSVRFTRKVLKYKNISFLSSLIEYNALRKMSAVIPPLIISALLPFAFDYRSTWFTASEKITWIYFFIALLFSVNAVLNSVGNVLMNKEQLQNRPMKGFIQIFQVIFSCIAIIVIISILINKSPLNLITGLGAFAAVLMLIFKDTILGFVAGVLLSENDMVHIGDWIEMPQNNVNGVVMDITLNIVKVQNFDNTIVTIPPYSLVSGSFINWRGMTESGGRRIMREYALKLDYIQPCTPEFLKKMKKFDADLADFITEKQKQAAEGKVANTDNPAGLVNGTIDTNVGLLRAYMTLYLKRHPFISKDLLLMVRTLAPTENGLPVQIYCFSANKNWPSYESIQAEIMEHFVSVLPEFGLYPFQNPTARDYVISGLIESGKDLSTVDGIPWHSVLPKEEKV